MAFVVRRPGGRWEIRESHHTEAGPRARTLVTFKSLSPEVIERAIKAAKYRVDRDALVRAAKRAGAHMEPSIGDDLARSLLRNVARGAHIRAGLARLVVDRLAGTHGVAHDDSFLEWLGASLEERARTLVDLLELADALPSRREGPLRFPRLTPARA